MSDEAGTSTAVVGEGDVGDRIAEWDGDTLLARARRGGGEPGAPRRGDQRPQRLPGARWRHRQEHDADDAGGAGGDARGGQGWAKGAGARAARLARGAMMGSRGNSGVILSQILRGFARGLGDAERFGGAELATALREAATTAYRAVQQPVEGTMLTVIRVAAEAAEEAVQKSRDLRPVLDAALVGARNALARTPELLPRLREAGVVDAGGRAWSRSSKGRRATPTASRSPIPRLPRRLASPGAT